MIDKQDVTILIMEDELATRKSLSLYLGSKGFRVMEAENGQIGLELFRKEKPHLILLDLLMPVVNGLEVLSFVTGESPEIPVIVISGTEKIADAVEALHLGAWDYVLKPIKDMSVLYHSVEKVLERVRLIRENKRYHEHLETEIEKRTKELILSNENLTREIKERKRMEEALRESEKTYRAIFNSATAALFISDQEGNIVEANIPARKSYGYKIEELLKLSVKNLIVPENLYKFERLLEKVKSSGHYQSELLTMRKDGSKIVNEVLATEVEYMGKKQLLHVFRDITERKEAEEKERLHHQQLIQADKMASLGILVSGVAHEINNPNNFIMVNAPILSKIYKTIEPVLEEHYNTHGDFYIAPRIKYTEMKGNIPGIISGILEGAQRIDHFVKELKNFARPTPSTIDAKIDINKVIQAGVTLLTNLIKKSTNRFHTNYSEKIPEIKGNFQRLEQVIVNLIENSCQALQNKDQGVFVSTQLDRTGKMVKIQVQDEGTGMTQETIKNLKNPFFTTKRSSGGTGLGLSISSKIVEDHKGILEFDSTPGMGTTATVLLPVEPGSSYQYPDKKEE